MGGCMGLLRTRTESIDVQSNDETRQNNGPTRKNQALCQENIRWKSDVPLTEGQLKSKRDEFWDTAPAFEGRKEIWDALRAAAVAGESSDFTLAQAILDGANVTVPGGYLTECYDELGTRYQVPIYCLYFPLNMVRGDGRDSPADCSEPVDDGTEIILKLRVSISSNDVKLKVFSKDTIAAAKRKLEEQEGIEVCRQRWYFGGKLLGEKVRVEDTKIPPGYVIQVVINPEPLSKVDS